ncbi:MAG: hypothetical protein GEV12_05930 [Micromonosporaceae bacterium]|nr:hypothetical protein [Micromonosporaceae bacterium]
MRTRYLVAVPLLAALLGGPAVAGCTDDGDGDGGDWDDAVVAYVGEVAITEAEVDQLAGSVRTEIAAEIEQELERLTDEMDEAELAEHRERRFGELDQQVAVTRTRVIEMRILTEAADRHIAAEGLDPPEVPQSAIDQQATDLGLSASNAYVLLVTDFLSTLGVLQRTVEAVEPSETEQREVYDNLVAEGLTTVPFEEARAVLNQELMGQQVSIRNLLADVVDRAGVRVSPAYDLVYRVPVPVGDGQSWLALPLSDRS